MTRLSNEGGDDDDDDDKDSISLLSDDEILRILSFLKTDDAVAMSFALFKRWPLWELVPRLVFDDRTSLLKLLVDGDSRSHNLMSPDHERFTRFVDGALRLNKAPVLEIFNLTFGVSCNHEDIRRWIQIAIHRSVCEMTIHRYHSMWPVRLPGYIFMCRTLVVLKLVKGIIVDVAYPIHLPSLKTLHLLSIHYTSSESFTRLVSCSPVLEDLVVTSFLNHDLTIVTVPVPSLQRFSLSSIGFLILDIDAPSLKELRITTYHCAKTWVLRIPEVVEAHVKVYQNDLEKFLTAIPSVTCLCLHLLPEKAGYPEGRILNRLVHLKLKMHLSYEWDTLMSFLQHCPRLRFLKIDQPHDDIDPGKAFSQPGEVPECLLFHLETIVWDKYRGTAFEKEVAAYILEQARRLKKATFRVHAHSDSDRRFGMIVGDLELLPLGSPLCELEMKEM